MNFLKKLQAALLTLLLSHAVDAQPWILRGKIINKEQSMPLGSASVQVFQHGKVSGSVSNVDGIFQVSIPAEADSIKFSMIGYGSEKLNLPATSLTDNKFITIELQPAVVQLDEVIVKPLTALEIIQRAIAATQKMLPAYDFENHFFYREIIKDSSNYYSISEAVFKSQYFTSKKKYKLQMVKGRTKEDVAYTRLFEDFHPGGGPEETLNKNLHIGFPAFLDIKKTKWFVYHRDSVINDDGRKIYVISFDQKPEVHEALDAGKIYIDAKDFSLVSYELQNSLRGMKYVKSLMGTDKLFAELLHVDYKTKGWTTNASFIKVHDKLLLTHTYSKYQIAYRQSKKDIDLDLSIITEMAVTDEPSPVEQQIVKGEEWKRKNMVANLPTDFDADFWGNANVISPATELDSVITNISKRNNDVTVGKLAGGWQYLHKDLFVANQNNDSISLIPIAKGTWEDDETGGMLYQTITGDFTMETQLVITKRSDANEAPLNGFQQAGIIIRDSGGTKENNILLCIGTGGNSNAKYFLKKTENGKSKGPVDKIDAMKGWLRIEKRGSTVSCFIKSDTEREWSKITSYNVNWLNKPTQAGLMVMARFAGSGPKAQPDMKAIFTNFTISKN
ncbi:MAG: carboxypeptidase-like regulatory domain-containing protein [Ginsengibacter sp.]